VELSVEIVYALRDRQSVVRLHVAAGATLREAIARSGLLRQHPEIDLQRDKVGVFGQLRGLDEPVQAGDRVEIYRGLPADPKEMRRKRALSS
jgi:putative ubiquitin-RnfH superfamily antitoxin RatB of RatAB toxin-antitoxin module